MAVLAIAACDPENEVKVKNPIQISSPTPTRQITKVTLNETQQGYVAAGNAMSFRFLKEMYSGESLILSPLSLQYALAMTANGASDETLQEIIDFLGYGTEGIDALNEYCRILLEQLPAVDLDVDLKVTDALLVNDEFKLLQSFQKTVQDNYYAVVDNMDFSDAAQVAARINDWAKRNTNGFIDKILDASELSPFAAAYLMNALYFKAKWEGSTYHNMFDEGKTKDEKFTMSDGSTKTVKMMWTADNYGYSHKDGFKVLALPYAGGKFAMYFLLPDENDLAGLLEKLQSYSWQDIVDNLGYGREVHVKLPRFEIENKFELSDCLKALGVKRAFEDGNAQFDRMFEPKVGITGYHIEKVWQKARINVAEWGTEAAAVTVVEMYPESSGMPGEEPKISYFYADHPFAFILAERTSGTILFEGTFTGK